MKLKRIRKGLALVLGLLIGLIFIRMGVMKFDPQGFWTPSFEAWGFPVWFRLAIGVIETVGGALLVIPWVATWAGISLAAVMVGAGVMRTIDGSWGDVLTIVIYFALLLWIAWEWRSWRIPKPRAANED